MSKREASKGSGFRLVLIVGILVIVGIVLAGRRRGGGGETFEPFVAMTLEGQTLDLAELRGKVVLVDFWATWCGPCLMELPRVVRAYERYHDRGFEVVGVSLDTDLDRLESFLAANPELAWPQIADGRGWNGELPTRYGVRAIPHAVLLDRQGKVHEPAARGRRLDQALEALLGE